MGPDSRAPGRTRVSDYAPDVALLCITAIWGFTFVTVKQALASTTVFVFLALRFWLAAAAFGVFVPAARRGWDRELIKAGVVAGALFFAGYAFQTLGLARTSASHTGFITGLFVVFTPIFAALILKKPPHAGALVGVVLATFGLLLLTGGWAGRVNFGDVLVVGCAIAFALHIIALSRWAATVGWAPLALSQMIVMAAGATVAAVLFEPLKLPTSSQVWMAVVVTAVLATAVALTVQVWAQTRIGPTRTALILIMEPVFAGVFARIMVGERLDAAGWAGSALILAGMLIGEGSRVLRDRRAAAVPQFEED